MTLANLITFTRMLLSPFLLVLFLYYREFGVEAVYLPWILLGILAIIELSDAVDGYLARKLNQVTDIGKIIDPLADSITRISLFLAFTTPPINLSVIWVFILIYRDAWINLLRTLCAFNNIALGARRSGKIKTALLSAASFGMILMYLLHNYGLMTQSQLSEISNYLAGITSIYAFLTGLEYFYSQRHQVMSLLK